MDAPERECSVGARQLLAVCLEQYDVRSGQGTPGGAVHDAAGHCAITLLRV
jgi:hypothetical protein